MSPSTMKQWVVEDKEHGYDGLVYKDAAVPKVGENEVLVKLHAASLNYRDLIIPKVWLCKRKSDTSNLN
jgi:NADPH:quinone reductase-like Zn-dependent oxidoreductase